MNVLLLGSGGREHALAWKLAQSPLLDALYAAPGNPGIARHAMCVALDAIDHDAVLGFARTHAIGLVVIGPEAPLVDGLADTLRAGGVAVFGPGRAAAMLEGSKGFTKDLCARAGIPTAAYRRCTTLADAVAALDQFTLPTVIKADGLAAGKGVTIAETRAEALAALTAIFGNSPLASPFSNPSIPSAVGEAASIGPAVVIEAFLTGEEASLFALTDGVTVVALGSAQDHKRVGEGDTGPNTGGMGAYSPARVLTPELEARAMAEIVLPTVRALAAAGTPYSGVLYAGLMLTADGPSLIEYNARFGDPETQVLMPRMACDLLPLLLATAEGRLHEMPAPAMTSDAALTVVIAARGYPGTAAAGGAIVGITEAEATGGLVFQAGTAMRDGRLVACGGRVLAVTATGPDVTAARAAAYTAAGHIRYDDGFCRRDIGWREAAREAGATAG